MTMLSRALLLLGILACSSAYAQLTALTYDRSSSSAIVADADTATAALTDLGTGSAGCCVLGAAANAFDPFNQVLYAFGPDPADANAAWQLHAFNGSTGAALPDVTLGQTGRIIGAAFEQVPPRLLALRANTAGDIDLVEVNTATGVIGVLNVGVVDCCEATPNAVAYAGGVVYLSAQLRTAGTPTLFGFPVDGSAVTTVPTASALTVLNSDPDSGLLYGIQQAATASPVTASLNFVLVDPATGLFSQLGATLTDCCSIAPDIGAISTGSLTVMAQAIGASGYSLLSFNLVSGAASFSSAAIDSNRIINGMFDGAKGLDASTTTITSIVPSPSEIGQNYAVNVSVTATVAVSGTVTVSDGLGASCLITLPATSCMLASSTAGALTVSAVYGGAPGLAGSADTAAHMVDPATSTTTITSIAPAGSSTVGNAYTVNVAVAGFGVPTGTVAVGDGLGAACIITLPATACMLTSTTAGAVTISANYAGDTNNAASGDTAAYTIARAATTTAITSIVPAGSSPVGSPYTVSVGVSGGFGVIGGSVAVSDGSGASCNIALPATSCVLTSTVAGAKTIAANYSGDTNNLPSGATAAYVIDQVASTTTITSIAPVTMSTVGQPYSVNVAVTGYGPPTGTIVVNDGSGAMCNIVLPATSCALTSATTGAKTITAGYPGDGNNSASSDTAAYQIDPATSTTTINSVVPNPGQLGTPYTVSVTVTGFMPTGTVAVDDGTGSMCSIVLPATSCDLTSTVAGAKTITASYPGDASNSASSDTEAQMIDLAPSSTTITSITPAGSSTIGVAYTVNVSITGFGVPVGAVAVDDGDGATCNFVLPATSCMLTSTNAGPKTITASYAGDVNNDPSSDTEAYSIDQAASTTAITSFTPAGSSVVGVAYSVNVSVTGFGTPTGDVNVDDGTGETCTFTLPATSCMLTSNTAGAKTITAAYAGDGNNLPGDDTGSYQIDRAASTTVVPGVLPNPPTAGMPYTVTATVTGFGTPDGSIAVDDGNGATCTITLPATDCSLTSTVAGALTLAANYSGDTNNLPSSGSLVVTGQQAATATMLSALPDPAIVGMPVQLVAEVAQPGSAGVILAGNVDFLDGANGIPGCAAVPVLSGIAVCDTSFTPAGIRNLVANYLGDANNLPSSGTLDLQIDQVPTTTTLVVTPSQVLRNADVLLDITIAGGVVPYSGTVSVTSNGAPIAECQALVVSADSAGCVFRPQLAGQFTLVATYSGDVDDGASSGTAGLFVGAVELPVDSRWMILLMALGLLLIGTRAVNRR